MARRQYSELDRAAALASLAAHRGDLATTSRITGIPETTLRRWSVGQAFQPAQAFGAMRQPLPPNAQGPSPDAQGLTPPAWDDSADLYDQLAEVAQRMCAALLEKAAEASFPELCTGLGLVMDRMAALQSREDPSERWTADDEAAIAAEFDDLSDDEYIERVEEILNEAKAQQAAARQRAAPAPPVPDLPEAGDSSAALAVPACALDPAAPALASCASARASPVTPT